MDHFIPIDTPGGPIWVETDDLSDSDHIELLARKEEVFGDFKNSVEAIGKNAEFLINKMKELAPEEVEVTFGIKVGVETGVPVFGLAKASGEATYTVALKWISEKGESGKTPSKI